MNKFIPCLFCAFLSIPAMADIYLDKSAQEDPQGKALSYWVKKINAQQSGGRSVTYDKGKTIIYDSRDFSIFAESAPKELIDWELKSRLKKMLYFPPERRDYRNTLIPLKYEIDLAYQKKDPVFRELVEFLFFDKDLAVPKQQMPFTNYDQLKAVIQWLKSFYTSKDRVMFFIENKKPSYARHLTMNAKLGLQPELLPELKAALPKAPANFKLVMAKWILQMSPNDPEAIKIIETEVLSKGVNPKTLPKLTMLPDLKYLKQALSTEEWVYKKHYQSEAYMAIKNAALIHKEKVLPILAEHILDQDIPFFSTKKASLSTLASLEEASLPYLVKFIESDNNELQNLTIRELTKLGEKAKTEIPAIQNQIKKSPDRKISLIKLLYKISGDPELALNELIKNKAWEEKGAARIFVNLLNKLETIPEPMQKILLARLKNKKISITTDLVLLAEKHPDLGKQIFRILQNQQPSKTFLRNSTSQTINQFFRASKDFELTLKYFGPSTLYTHQLANFIKIQGESTGDFNKAMEMFYAIEKKYLQRPQNKNGMAASHRHSLHILLKVKNNLNPTIRKQLLKSWFSTHSTARIDPQNYPFLIDMTESKDSKIVKNARVRLLIGRTDFGLFSEDDLNKYIEWLEKNLKTNTNIKERLMALEQLSKIQSNKGRAKVIPILISSLDDPMDQVAGAAQKDLEKQGTLAMPELIKIIKGDNNYLGIIACQVIGGMSIYGKEAVPTLIDIVKKHKNLGIQLAAIEALGKIGPPAKSSVPVLKACLTGKNNDLKIPAARALVMQGGIPKGDPILVEIVNSNIVPENSKDRLRFENLIMQGIK